MLIRRMEHSSATTGGTPVPTVALLALLGMLPFCSLLVSHVVYQQDGSTGFIQSDMSYYVANGREIFERGNGLGYCNPYDPAADAPVIYYHWLPWLFGLGVKFLHIDPGVWFVLLGLAGGYSCSWGTFRLVEAVLPTRYFLPSLYLSAMWGGGLFAVAAVATEFSAGGGCPDFVRFDPFGGWWFLNWGRNLVYTTESIYHALVAWAWVGIVRRQPWHAAGPIIALSATHPFSGLQHLSIMLAWFTLAVFVPPSWPVAAPQSLVKYRRSIVAGWLMLMLTAALFGAYYFLYLPSFPQHAAIAQGWALPWVLPWRAFVLAYTPVAVLAAIRCWQDMNRWRTEMSFFVIAAGISILLAKHDLFAPPHQPLHFTRGYIWMPLALLALPLVQSNAAMLIARTRPAVATILLSATACLAVLDNVTWLATRCLLGDHGVRLQAVDREVCEWLERAGVEDVLLYIVPGRLCDNQLFATYTSVRPWIGHGFLTPRLDQRIAALGEWIGTSHLPELLANVGILVIAADMIYPIDEGEWKTVFENKDRRVLQRRVRPSAERLP